MTDVDETLRAGPANALVDVPGLRVGHHTRIGGGYLTGTTVVLAPAGGMVAGVDVGGGAPGTRETDLLGPTTLIERVHAIVLSGGSAYGLAAAAGVTDLLGERDVGFSVGSEAHHVVPIVPGAVLFDLGRGGKFSARPGEDFGRAATLAATADEALLGVGGAGTGAVVSGLKGGVGGASSVLPDGTVVAALVVVNASGSPIDPRTGELLGARSLLPGDAPALAQPTDAERRALLEALRWRPDASGVPVVADGAVGRNTTLVVIATDAAMTTAHCTRLAKMGQDGMARALNPVHTLVDGDVVFAVSTADRPAPDPAGLHAVLVAGGDVVTRAITRALLASRSVTTPVATWPGYLDLAPSVLVDAAVRAGGDGWNGA